MRADHLADGRSLPHPRRAWRGEGVVEHGFDHLRYVRNVNESKSLNFLRESALIIAASGMCEAGRILHHLKNGVGDPKNTILFVGYCAANTLGRRIRDKEEIVRIFGEEYKLKAHVEALDSFSGHADHNELLGYFDRIGGTKEKVWLVHGEPERSQALLEALNQRHSDRGEIEVAVLDQTVEF